MEKKQTQGTIKVRQAEENTEKETYCKKNKQKSRPGERRKANRKKHEDKE